MILKRLLKCFVAVLAVVLACALISGCVLGSIVAADLLRDRGGSRYEQLADWAVSKAKKLLDREKPLQSDAAQRRFLVKELTALRDSQLAVDAALLKELDAGGYTPEDPLIVSDPYGLSPLTAVMLFDTDEPARVSIHIDGDTPLTCVDYSFSGSGTRHILPVYGLYAGRVNAVSVMLTQPGGGTSTYTHRLQTDALPDFLAHEKVRATILDEAACQPGFTFTYRGNNAQISKAAFDLNGAYRWCLDPSACDLLQYMRFCGSYNGAESVFVSVGNVTYGAVGILEFNPLGKLLNAWYAPYGAHHDIEVTDDLLWVTGSSSPSEEQALLYALDRRTGEIAAVLDYADILQPTRNQTRDYPDVDNFYSIQDWCHMNSVALSGDDLVVSCRHQSTVACTDPSGRLKWLLGDPEGYFESFKRYLLEPVGDGFAWPYTQHAADVLPDQDGDPDTVDLLLFDNGDFRLPDDQRTSRLVQYRVNERLMTVEQVWAYGGDRTELYSYRHGDADLLPNGNRLGSFEPHDEKAGQSYAYAVEVTAEGAPVWECWRVSADAAHSYGEYRLDRLDIYADSANDLRLGIPATLFLPEVEE